MLFELKVMCGFLALCAAPALLAATWTDWFVEHPVDIDLTGLDQLTDTFRRVSEDVEKMVAAMITLTPSLAQVEAEMKRVQGEYAERNRTLLAAILGEVVVLTEDPPTFMAQALLDTANDYAKELLDGIPPTPFFSVIVGVAPDVGKFNITVMWTVRTIASLPVEGARRLDKDTLREAFCEATRMCVFQLIGDEEVEE